MLSYVRLGKLFPINVVMFDLIVAVAFTRAVLAVVSAAATPAVLGYVIVSVPLPPSIISIIS